MKVALIHDHLAQDGGAEKVLKVFTEMFPEATIYTLLHDKKYTDKYFKNCKIETSIIQKFPGGVKHYKWYMPLMPMAVEFFDLSGYDLIISSASAFAKGVITPSRTLHICYCHTPTRYLWSDTHQYINELKYNKYFKKIISLVLNYVRIWDKVAADRVDKYIANSKTVQRRISKYYKRDSVIIYPSIEEKKFYVSQNLGDYFLAGCRLVPYKRIDIVIKAFKHFAAGQPVQGDRAGQMSHIAGEKDRKAPKLKIFGDGIDTERLKKIAGNSENIEFLGRVSDRERAELYSKCQAYINPQKEDFGITIVEAMASGRPVIALKQGGAIETIIEGKTGVFFNNETPEALIKAIKDFKDNHFNSQEIREHALQFSTKNFKNKISQFIKEEYKKW